MRMFFIFFLYFININLHAKILDSFYESLFKKDLKKEKFNLYCHVYVLEGNLVLIGYCDMHQYSKLMRISKSHYKNNFFDFLIIDNNVKDNQVLVSELTRKYLIDKKKIKRLYLHIYDNILYIIASTRDQYEKDYLKKIGELIKEDYPEIKNIEYCLF